MPQRRSVRPEWDGLLFAALVMSAVVATTALCVREATRWVDRVYPGFLVYRNGIVCLLNQPGWPGPRAGVHFPDRVVAVEGIPVSSGDEVIERIAGASPGTPVSYTIRRGGEVRTVVVPVSRLTLQQVFFTLGPLVFAGIVSIALGLVVLVLEPTRVATRSFFFFAALLGLWAICKFDHGTDHRFSSLVFFAASFLPMAAVHFALNFPVPRSGARGSRAALLYLPSVALFLAFLFTHDGDTYLFVATQRLNFVLGLVSIFAVLGSWLLAYRRPATPEIRERGRLLLFGTLLSSLPVLAVLGGVALGLAIPISLLALALPGYAALLAYSIVRQNLFAIRSVPYPKLARPAILLIATASYLALAAVAAGILQSSPAEKNLYAAILFVLSLIVCFQPMQSWLKRALDQTFFRGSYELRGIVQALSAKLGSLRDHEAAVTLILRTIRDAVGAERIAILLLDSAALRGRLYSLSRDGHLEMERGTAGHELDKVEVLLPLEVGSRTAGYVIADRKPDGAPYRAEDLDFLRTVSEEVAVSLENARLYGEREALARELQDFAMASVFALELKSELLTIHLRESPEKAKATAGELSATAEQIMRSLRGYIGRIQGPIAAEGPR